MKLSDEFETCPCNLFQVSGNKGTKYLCKQTACFGMPGLVVEFPIEIENYYSFQELVWPILKSLGQTVVYMNKSATNIYAKIMFYLFPSHSD